VEVITLLFEGLSSFMCVYTHIMCVCVCVCVCVCIHMSRYIISFGTGKKLTYDGVEFLELLYDSPDP
jgi:hypothetical protein